MQSYNKVIQLFANIAAAHEQVNSFGAGEVWQIDAAHEPSIMPKLWVVPGEVSVSDNVMTYGLTVLCFDLVRKDEDNLQEVLSDTQLILLDIVKVLREYQTEWFMLSGDPRLNSFTERFGEDVSGWRMDIQLDVDFANNACDMPMTDFVIPGSGSGGGGGDGGGACCEGEPGEVLYYGADGLVTSDEYFKRNGLTFEIGAKSGSDPALSFGSDGLRIGWSVEGGANFDLPTLQGNPGEVLTEDGDGNLYWAPGGSDADQWIDDHGTALLDHLTDTNNPHATTAAQVGAYPDTNPDNYIDAAGAPVQSVNTQTGAVVLDASDVGAPSGSGTSTGTNTGDQDLTGLQGKRIVISSNATAVLDGAYTLVASATFTDPTPSEGKGYSVFIRNGTATIGGTPYSTVGTMVWRLFHSGSWATYVLTNQTQLDLKQENLLIASATASNSAVIDFTLPTGYSYFELFIEHLIPQTNATSMFLRVSVDGGATFLAGASDYEVHRNTLTGSGGIIYVPSYGLAAQIAPIGALIGNTAGRFFRASFRIFDPSNATQNKNITGEISMLRSDGQPTLSNLSARVFNTSAVNAIRLLMNSGNIASGTFKLYGYKS